MGDAVVKRHGPKGPTPDVPPVGGVPREAGTWMLHIVAAEVALVLLVLIVRNPLDINPDSALYLDAGRLLIAGQVPYVDFIDTNPPLIFYLNAVPAYIGKLFSISAITAFSCIVLLLVAWSAWAIGRVASRSGLEHDRSDLAMVMLGWVAVSLMFKCVELHAEERISLFGQREHLFMLLYAPLFTVRWSRWNGGHVSRTMAVAAGVAGGVGACIKPHFVVIALVPELSWLLARRRFRPFVKAEALAFAGTGFVYAAHFFLLPSTLQDTIFHRWLPLVTATYSGWALPVRTTIALPEIHLALTVAFLPFVFPSLRRGAFGSMGLPLAAMTVVGVAAYMVARKGLAYHALPAYVAAVLIAAIASCSIGRSTVSALAAWLALAAMVIGYVGYTVAEQVDIIPQAMLVVFAALVIARAYVRIGDYLGRLPHPTMLLPVHRAIPHLLFVAVVGAMLWQWHKRGDVLPYAGDGLAESIRSHSEEGDPVLVVTTSDSPTYPLLLQLNRRPGSRYLLAYPLLKSMRTRPDLVPGGSSARPGSGGSFRDEYLNELAADIATRRPPVIYVDAGRCDGCPEHSSILGYLMSTGFVGRAMFGYRPLPWELRRQGWNPMKVFVRDTTSVGSAVQRVPRTPKAPFVRGRRGWTKRGEGGTLR